MRSSILLLIVPLFALSKVCSEATFATLASPSTHYVSLDGSDDGPGTAGRPWGTVNHAAEQAQAGETIIVRAGHYNLPAQIRLRNSGRHDAWITFAGDPGGNVILDAANVPRSSLFQKGEPQQDYDNGVFQIQDVSFIRVTNLSVINSQDAGFTIRDSSYVDLLNNSTDRTFSSGIAVWDTSHQGKATQHIRILGNIVRRATSWDAAPPNIPRVGVAPQEGLSVAGAIHFEVAHNEVFDASGAQIGIDIKETSKYGKLHHNHVHNVGLGIYVDAWFGTLSDIEIYSNVVHDCQGAGIALSVEQGTSVEHIDLHNNLVFGNLGSGIYFSRWGVNNERRNITISHNTFYHNGYGPPASGQSYYWMTGGLYLYSTSVRDITISDNIFSQNRGFQIGYSELFLHRSRSWLSVAEEKNIKINRNLIDGDNPETPIESGGDPIDRVKIYAVAGSHAIFGDPMFKNISAQDFTLRHGSPAAARSIAVGAFPSVGRR